MNRSFVLTMAICALAVLTSRLAAEAPKVPDRTLTVPAAEKGSPDPVSLSILMCKLLTSR